MNPIEQPQVSLARQYGEYELRYHCKADPLGNTLGASVVAGLAVGLPEFNVRQYFSTQPTIFYDYDHVVTGYAAESGTAIGLLGARWLGSPELRFLYLWTAMIADAYRHSHLFRRMVGYFFERIAEEKGWSGMPTLVVTKTYSPVVYNLFRSATRGAEGVDIYPRICEGDQDRGMVELAGQIARAISPALVLDPDSGTVLGGQAMVAPDFFPRMEECNDADVNEHFRLHLTRSDQILCIVKIAERVKKAMYLRMAARGASVAVTPTTGVGQIA